MKKIFLKIFTLFFVLINYSYSDSVQVFNFSKNELDNLKVKKLKKLTTYTLGSNDNGNFLRGQGLYNINLPLSQKIKSNSARFYFNYNKS